MTENHRATKAIIMAAGKGRRLLPVTETTPKPLLDVNGKKMLETLISALIQNDIFEIHIVVGYLKEQFEYLPKKYKNVKINLLINPYYDSCNNISSLYVARAHLGNCIIADADLIIHNQKILRPEFEASGYCSTWAEEETTEWLQDTDDNGYVLSCSRTGGKKGWQLYSVSFWSEEDGKKLKAHLEELFEQRAITNIFWDDIPMFYFKDDYKLKIRQINPEDLDEIDNLEELAALDSKYKGVLV